MKISVRTTAQEKKAMDGARSEGWGGCFQLRMVSCLIMTCGLHTCVISPKPDSNLEKTKTQNRNYPGSPQDYPSRRKLDLDGKVLSCGAEKVFRAH